MRGRLHKWYKHITLFQWRCKMRVLLLTQVLPYPPDSGPKVKTYHVLKYLAQNHQVTLVSFVRDTDKPEYIQHLETLCERVITVPIKRAPLRDLLFLGKSLLTGQPWMMLRDERPEMRAALQELAATTQFDVVHADQLNMGQYALPLPRVARCWIYTMRCGCFINEWHRPYRCIIR